MTASSTPGLALWRNREATQPAESTLSFTGRDLERIVEPGEIIFRVGTAGETFAGPVPVQLVGETRTIRGERVMDTPVTVSNAR